MIEDKLRELAELRAQKEALDAQSKDVEEKIEHLHAVIVEEFESRQIKSMKLEGVGSFSIRVSSYPKLYDPATFREWLDRQGISWEVVTALNAQKLRAFYNERLELGQELPPGIEQFTKATIAVKKEA